MADLFSMLDTSSLDTTARFLLDITLIMIIGGLSALIFSRLRMPAIIGYLAAGILVGPQFPLHLVQDLELIDFMADLGIILLMFTIGLELDLRKLRELGPAILLAGAIESVLMITFGYFAGVLMGWSELESLFLGAVLVCSSTAIILKVLTETGRIGRDTTPTLISILVVEDFISVIILAMASPVITGADLTATSVLATIVSILAFVTLSVILGLAVIPRAMDRVSGRYSSETVLLVSLGLCFSLAITSLLLGFSVAIGAFLMGVIISRSRCAHQVVKETTPIEQMFMAIFFVSIGMLIDPVVIWNNLWVVLLVAGVFMGGKMVAITIGCFTANMEAKQSLGLGMSMMAMGEFSFVLAKMGTDGGVVGPSFYSTVVGAALVTVMVMPYIIKNDDRIIEWLVQHIPRGLRGDLRRLEEVRETARQRIRVDEVKRRTIRREVIGLAVDATYLFVVFVLANAVHGFEIMLDMLMDTVPVIAYLIFIEVVLALLLPALLNIKTRLGRIADIMTSSALESGKYAARMGWLFHRMFTATMWVLIFMFLASFLSPIIGEVMQLPMVTAIILAIAGGVMLLLLWNLFDSVHNKVCTELGRGLMTDETCPETMVEKEQEPRTPGQKV